MNTTFAEAIWFLPFVALLTIYVSWTDMKFMLIKNQAVLALMLIFLVIGPFAFSFDVYLWRWLQFLIVLVLGILFNAAGVLGAGDAKYAAAMAPFIAPEDTMPVIFLFSGVLLAAFVTHRIFKFIPAMQRATPDWKSWQEERLFPMGLAISFTLFAYLLLSVLRGMGV